MSSAEQPLLEAIRACPSDDESHLVYADWLEDLGKRPLRAEAIRREIESRRLLCVQDVHGILEVERHFCVTYTEDQLQPLTTMPFSKETLVECAGSHVLVPGYPLSLSDIQKEHPDLFYINFEPWFVEEAFATEERIGRRWQLLRKAPIPHSLGRAYDDQTVLLSDNEEVPRAVDVTYMVILHLLATSERLLQNMFVRCRDVDSDGRRVGVGAHDSDGFVVHDYWDVIHRVYLGLSSAKKIPHQEENTDAEHA